MDLFAKDFVKKFSISFQGPKFVYSLCFKFENAASIASFYCNESIPLIIKYSFIFFPLTLLFIFIFFPFALLFFNVTMINTFI